SVCFPKPGTTIILLGFLVFLEPKQAPVFDIKPESIDVPFGESADFECHVTGAQPIHITWSKDGQEIRTGRNYNITFTDNTAHLRVLRVGKGDSGQYTCQASNEAGKDFCSAQLSVKEPPKFVKKPEALRFVKQGDTVQLECTISGTPEIRIAWYKNDQALQASDRLHISFVDSVAMLTISGATADDAGDYICEAHNSAGTASCSTSLFVKGVFGCVRERTVISVHSLPAALPQLSLLLLIYTFPQSLRSL
uniref:Ig-like domain-containing protein n=1 Tax=Malurus cyaneus samueli TaxID=2593467 RepID=A0A8C5TTR2_9PASS